MFNCRIIVSPIPKYCAVIYLRYMNIAILLPKCPVLPVSDEGENKDLVCGRDVEAFLK